MGITHQARVLTLTQTASRETGTEGAVLAHTHTHTVLTLLCSCVNWEFSLSIHTQHKNKTVTPSQINKLFFNALKHLRTKIYSFHQTEAKMKI